jgi:ribosome modulation factor
MNCREPRGLLEMLLRHRPSSNGVFGIEARHIDIELFGEQDFLAVFGGNTVYFHLWRTNIIAQGISLYRAVATEHFHSADHATPPPPPTYDARSLQGWIEHVADTENGNVTFLRRAGLAARGLCYEDIIEDREKTVLAIAKVLSVRLTQGHLDRKPDDVRIKVGDDWNLQTEARFRSENADFVNRVEAGRLVTRGLTFRPAAEAGALSAATQAGQLAAFLAGKSAGAAGDAVAGNPYTAGTHAAESWMQGWRAGWDTHPDCGFQPQPRNAGS